MRGQRVITDAAQEPRVNERLPHHCCNAEQHRYRHTDKVTAHRALGEIDCL